MTTRTIGAIGLSFPGLRTIDSAELEFLEILADTCAQALVRIRAQDEAAMQSAKLTFLADASTELSRSLNYEATLSKVAQLAVPNFADWCAIDVVEDGRLHRVAVAHIDPEKVQLALDLQQRYPSDPNSPSGAWNVMRTGSSELVAEITDEMLVAGARDEEHLRLARELHLRSALVVPLVARGKVLGTITWVWAESERVYTEKDVAFAEDLAKRAAVAIDNSELHSETLAAAVQLQHAVLPEAMPVVPGWALSSHYRPAGRTEVGGDFYDAVPLGEDRMVLFVGDVMGRGVAAAAAMAQMRAAVLAYAAGDPTPQVVMKRLDQMFAQYMTEQLVTLVYMLVDTSRNELMVANAGHPPPVLLRADGTVEQLPLADGSPLGTLPQERQQMRVHFHAGDTVLAFTDGLIERRGEDIDRGQERVLQALQTLSQPDLDAALREVVERVREPARHDDVAALAARRLLLREPRESGGQLQHRPALLCPDLDRGDVLTAGCRCGAEPHGRARERAPRADLLGPPVTGVDDQDVGRRGCRRVGAPISHVGAGQVEAGAPGHCREGHAGAYGDRTDGRHRLAGGTRGGRAGRGGRSRP